MSASTTPSAQPPQTKPPGRGLAIASLVCGIGGLLTCGLSAIVGVILGIVALVKMSKAAATGGKGLAIAGLVVSGLGVLLIPVMGMLAGILLPAVTRARHLAHKAVFMNNMKQLSVATMMYTTEQDGRLPPHQSWQEEFERQGHVGNIDDLTRAPSEPEAGRAVAMNAALGRLPIDAVPSATRTVLFFECRPGAPPAGGPDLLPPEPRYTGGYVIAFCDGHVESVRPEAISDLVWDPHGGR